MKQSLDQFHLPEYILLDKSTLSRNKLHYRSSLLLLYQDILNQEYNHLGVILNSFSGSCSRGGGWRTFPSSYFEYRDSSYIDLYIPNHSSEISEYVLVDTIQKDGKIIETPYFSTPVHIKNRIKLFKLEKGTYDIKGRVRIIGYNDKVEDIPFRNSFEVN